MPSKAGGYIAEGFVARFHVKHGTLTNYFPIGPFSCLAFGQIICHSVSMTDITSSKIIDDLGENRLIDELGFTERNLRHIRRQGKFPGAWYSPLKSLCDIHGVYCPLSAFVWKTPDKKHGNAKVEIQGRVRKASNSASSKASNTCASIVAEKAGE